MQLYLVRHPQPADVTGLCYGRREVPVGPESVADAAAEVRGRIPERVLEGARIFSSPASRCLILARCLAAPREPTVAEDLAEMDFGSWEGRAWDQVPRAQLDAWARDIWHYRPGGVESAAMVAARWQRWVKHVGNGDDAVVAVTHAGVIRVALALALALANADADADGGAGAGEDAGMLHAAALLQVPVAFGSVHFVDVAAAPVPA
jgi:alpha-ribazole phosphatase